MVFCLDWLLSACLLACCLQFIRKRSFAARAATARRAGGWAEDSLCVRRVFKRAAGPNVNLRKDEWQVRHCGMGRPVGNGMADIGTVCVQGGQVSARSAESRMNTRSRRSSRHTRLKDERIERHV